jgi:hypothetical protein
MTVVARCTVLVMLTCPATTWAQGPRCDFSKVPGAVWWGTQAQMPVARLAAYLAPVIWFSPDEPSLNRTSGMDIRIPEAFPGQPVPDRPVLYYQVDCVRTKPGAKGLAVVRSPEGPAHSAIDLNNVSVVVLSYFAYYPTEEGLGAHPHDIEPAEFRALVLRHTWPGFSEWIPGGAQCANPTNVIVVTRVTGKAHGLVWFWNVLHVDDDTRFPMHLLIEEGKHAIATDKNGDGVFTKSYDVNVRVNDAWGVRDIIRSGMLFSGGYESWMAKTRRPEHRVLPPLPEDSPLIPELKRRAIAQNVVYELRPYPPAGSAGDDHQLAHLMDDKAVPNWPTETSVENVGKALDEGAVLKSLSIAARADGDFGVSWAFPFFVVKHLEEPMTGGYILQRMYATSGNHHEFGWTALYTPSASRWLDTYLAAGAEHAWYPDASGANVASWDFVFETGLKFRVNINETPLKALSFFTDYWGLRMGIRNRGFFDVHNLTYVLELGAGSF